MAAASVSDVPRAVAAAKSVAASLGLEADDAIVLHASNRVAVRLLPCDVLARVARPAHEAAQFEINLAMKLADTDSPVATLDPRVAPRVHLHDGFVITLWTYYETRPSHGLSPVDYAEVLSRLHVDMRDIELPTPHFLDRVRQAQKLVARRDQAVEITFADRELLAAAFATSTSAIRERGAPDQMLHGEPHPGNVLNTKHGPLFVDLETCCRGPVEFDLAHVPKEVSERYPDVDAALLGQCRILVLAMVAAWRLDPADRFPGGRQALDELLTALRAGPPYPALGAISGLA